MDDKFQKNKDKTPPKFYSIQTKPNHPRWKSGFGNNNNEEEMIK